MAEPGVRGAAGDGHRLPLVNGYGYISGNPVTDPEKIAERAKFFQARAGFYFANWPELYGKWQRKMQALIEELEELKVPELPEYERDEVVFGTATTSPSTRCWTPTAGRCASRPDVAAPLRAATARLRRVRTFAEFCKTQMPDIPDQHIAQMVAGIDVILFKPDAELRRLARLAIDRGVDGAFVQGRTPAEIDASLARDEAGREWLAELEASRSRGLTWPPVMALPLLPQLEGRPEIPYASLVGHIESIRGGTRLGGRPRRSRANANDSPRSTGH